MEEGGNFDYEDDSVVLRYPNFLSEMKLEELTEKLSDDMANVIDNNVCFSMPYSDYGYEFDVLKNEDNVIGFRVAGIGSWINTPQVKLEQACIGGDLQKVKELLTNPILKEKAEIDYGVFYHACCNQHKEIIKYLLSSPDLEQHVLINNKQDHRFMTPFTILCHSNPEMVKELINELPEKSVQDIKELIKNTNYVTKNKEELIQTLDLRETKDNILKIRSPGVKETNIPKV